MDIIERFRELRREKKSQSQIPILNEIFHPPTHPTQRRQEKQKNTHKKNFTKMANVTLEHDHAKNKPTRIAQGKTKLANHKDPRTATLKTTAASDKNRITLSDNDSHKQYKTINKTQGLRVLKIGDVTYALYALASGGMCDVYRASAPNPDVPTLTVKILKACWVTKEHVRRQFNYEAQILKGLRQPLLPAFVRTGQTRTSMYIAYEYIPGTPLITLAQQKKLYGQRHALKRVNQIMLNVLDQVAYLHSKSDAIVHGDISAENVLISPEGTVHLVDFGCAHLRHVPNDAARNWIGKPSYLSPEQARGEVWAAPSDVYQLGILFYELVTDKRWIHGKTTRDKVIRAANITSPPKDFLQTTAPLALSAWIADCLQADPDKRPKDVAELSKRLYSIHGDL
jgi:serine/threonine-protein kinase